MQLKQRLSYIYLVLVPLLVVAIGFGITPVSYKIYLPIWLVNVIIMLVAAWILGAHLLKSQDAEKKQLSATALFFIIPWVFISIFAGFGPPPNTIAGWTATATQQETRYIILIVCGILIAIGFALLKEKLKTAGENFYSAIGFTAIIIAAPIFLINMMYWGSFLTEAFQNFTTAPGEKRPVWFAALRLQYGLMSTVEVGLTYLATAAFAASLKSAGWFSLAACRVYMIISFIGFLLNLAPPSFPEPFSTISYVVSVPAIPFIMPYLMGVNLLRRTAK